MSNMSQLVYRRIFSNENLYSANRLQFTIPDDIRQVEIDFFPGGTMQTGVINYVGMTVNDNTTMTYGMKTKEHSGSSYVSWTGTSWTVYTCLTTGSNNGSTQLVFYPKKNDEGSDANFQCHYKFHAASPAGFPLETGYLWADDSTNRASTFELACNDAVVSFGLEIRYVK